MYRRKEEADKNGNNDNNKLNFIHPDEWKMYWKKHDQNEKRWMKKFKISGSIKGGIQEDNKFTKADYERDDCIIC